MSWTTFHFCDFFGHFERQGPRSPDAGPWRSAATAAGPAALPAAFGRWLGASAAPELRTARSSSRSRICCHTWETSKMASMPLANGKSCYIVFGPKWNLDTRVGANSANRPTHEPTSYDWYHWSLQLPPWTIAGTKPLYNNWPIPPKTDEVGGKAFPPQIQQCSFRGPEPVFKTSTSTKMLYQCSMSMSHVCDPWVSKVWIVQSDCSINGCGHWIPPDRSTHVPRQTRERERKKTSKQTKTIKNMSQQNQHDS